MYIVQPDRYSCGPVAIKNLLTWANQSNTFSLNKLIDLCKCGPPDGTYFSDIHTVLRTVCSKARINLEQIIFSPTYDQMESYLSAKDKHAIILLLHWSSINLEEGSEQEVERHDRHTSGEHYVLVLPSDDNNKEFLIINSDDPKKGRPLTEILDEEQFRQYLRPYVYEEGEYYEDINDCIYPKAFLFACPSNKRSGDDKQSRKRRRN